MAGHRFLRLRRASLRPFEAAQIAEVLEARRLLAAVSEAGLIEDPQPAATVAENLVVAAEESAEECLPVECSEGTVDVVQGVVDEELPGEPSFADPVTEEVVPDREDVGTAEFRPILVVCEFPETLWSRCPDAGEWDWSTDFSTVRGFEDQTEYVPLDVAENFDFTDTTLIENEVSDEGTWTDFVDVGSEVTGDISADDTSGMEFLSEDQVLWSNDLNLPVGEESEPQVMLFNSPRGGFGVDLRMLTLSVPDEVPQVSSPPLPSTFVPEQRRMESVFSVRNGAVGLSGDRAADSRLVAARTESRAATPGPATSVLPKRSTLLTGSLSDSATPQDAAAVEGREELDIFGDGRAAEDKKKSRSRQSQSESRDDAPVTQTFELTGAGGARTTPEYFDSGETMSVSVDPETAAVSGLATGKQAPR